MTLGVRHARTRKLAFGAPKAWLSPILGPTPRTRRNAMGFMDSIKEALGGDRDDDADVNASVASTTPTAPKHVDPDAPAERTYGIEATGGKHAARD
jgi:hypothetical protein